MEILGVVVIGTLDVLVPAALGAWVIVLNARHHRSLHNESLFWFLTALVLILPLLAAVDGITGVPNYDGGGVVATTLLTFPGFFVPMVATVSLSGVFFDDRSWASLGYFAVMPAYLAGTVLWQLFVIAAIRRLVQVSRRGPVVAHNATGRAPEGDAARA